MAKQDQPQNPTYSLLYVDDDKQNLFLFSTLLDQDYRVLTTDSGPKALLLLEKHDIQVIFADQRMPEMSGIQLLEAVSRDHPEIIRILVTGYADIDVVIDAINRGSVYRYISKPWDNDELVATIRNAVELYELKQKNLALIASLNTQNQLLQRKVRELKFLNDLSIELTELGDFEAIASRFKTRLRQELHAEKGYFLPQRKPTPADSSTKEILSKLNLKRISGDTDLIKVDHDKTACILSLDFQDLDFGWLVLLFSPKAQPDRSDIDFAKAAANVASSVLYSLHVQQDRLEKEKFFILGRTASMIVHDIKGPLTTMQGFIHLLEGDVASPEREKYTHLVLAEINRLLEMIEELLFFSKGKVHLKLEAIELETLLRDCLSLFSVSFEKEQIESRLKVTRGCSLYGDYQKLKKAMLNILYNARENLKFIRVNRRIEISAHSEDGLVEIKIGNNGNPIPAEIASRIFDPFFSYNKEDGTGLGLTICKNIIEEHQGSINLELSGNMTEFIVRLPKMHHPAQEE